jgi:hypothetical protein
MTRRATAALVAAALAAALVVRCASLGAAGFAEDEIEKYHAAEAYRRGQFSVDAEHPMLLKLAVAASLQIARLWNTHAPSITAPISDEAAVRAPTAVFGALTVVPLFVLGTSLFGMPVGVLAAWLWALDINAIAINRIAKEDTFFAFFLLVAMAVYEHARGMPASDGRAAQRLYAISGACFGLMLASKYLPHYLGLHSLYRILIGPPPDGTPPRPRLYLWTMAAAFAVANFAIVLPETWSGVLDYLRTEGGATGHNGYPFAGIVYSNRVYETPFGVPAWFYAAILATKVPVLVLALAVIGTVVLLKPELVRVRVFFALLLVVPFLGYSLFASKFVRYLLPSFALIDLLAALGLGSLAAAVSRRALLAGPGAALRRIPGDLGWTAAALAVVVVVALGVDIASSAPFYGLYENGVRPRGYGPDLLFPHCELYDAGLREATVYVARHARPRDLVLTDAPNVVREYLARQGRHDLRVVSLSAARRAYPGSWTLVQPGRVYFENRAVVEHLLHEEVPVHHVDVARHFAVGVYRIPPAHIVRRGGDEQAPGHLPRWHPK